MLGQVVGMGLSLLLLWTGRDKVHTPTFGGTQEQRFAQALAHFRERMGIEERVELVSGPRPTGTNWCASVRYRFTQRIRPEALQPGAAVVAWHGEGKACGSQKPEFWALHEACHIRFAHHRLDLGRDAEERETRKCMVAYSQKERR